MATDKQTGVPLLPRDYAALRARPPQGAPITIAVAAGDSTSPASTRARALVVTGAKLDWTGKGLTISGVAGEAPFGQGVRALVTARFEETGEGAALVDLHAVPEQACSIALAGAGAQSTKSLLRIDLKEISIRRGPGPGFIGLVEVPALAGARLEATIFPSGTWVVEAAQAAQRLDQILPSEDGLLFPEIAAVLKQVTGVLDLPIQRLAIGVDPIRRRFGYFAITIVPKGPWDIIPGRLSFALQRIELAIHHPTSVRDRSVCGEIQGKLAIGAAGKAVSFLLSNKASARNPYGRWLLMPVSPAIPIADVLDTVGLRQEVTDALPSWGKEVLENTKFVRLAMGFDFSGPRVSSLEGGLRWDRRIAIPGLSGSWIDSLEIGLAIDAPFGPGPSSIEFDFAGRATLAAKEFSLSGRAGKRGWELAASYRGSLSLTAAFESLAVTATGSATQLFGDVDVSLRRPRLVLGSEGFSFDSQVTVQKRSGDTFSLAGGGLTFKPGRIQVQRRDQQVSFLLEAGISVQWQDGLKLEHAGLVVRQDGKGTLVEARAAASFPPAKGDQEPARVQVRGEYLRAGKGSAFKFAGQARDVSLSAIADGFMRLFGQRLPDDFPRLTAAELLLEFNTATGEFLVKGTTKAGAFRIGETQFKDTTFAFTIDRKRRGSAAEATTRVELIGSATIGDIKFKIDLGTDKGGMFIGAQAEGTMYLGQFASAFLPGVQLQKDDLALSRVGFRYAGQRFRFFAEWPGEGDIYFITGGKDGALFLLRPGNQVPYLSQTEISWSGVEQKDFVLQDQSDPHSEKRYSFRKGFYAAGKLDLRSAKIGQLLAVKGPIELAFEDQRLRIGPPAPALPAEAGKAQETQPGAPAKAQETKPSAPAKAGERESAQGDPDTSWYEGPYSLATVIDKISPVKEGQPKSAWRDYLGQGLRLEHVGVTPKSKPRSLRLEADATLTIGPWVSATAKGLSVLLTPRRDFSLSKLTSLDAEFDLKGAALTVDVQPWFKLNAAALLTKGQDRLRDQVRDLLIVSGVGQVELLKKLQIGVLVKLVLARTAPSPGFRFSEAFGFVCATGFTLGSPAFALTGLAGGFGYNCVLELPDRPEKVADFLLISMLQGGGEKDPAGEPAALLKQLTRFEQIVKSRPGALSIAFGLTFKIAELVDCVALVVVQLLNPGFELALLGVARMTLGPKGATKALGQIELALVARFSSTEGTLQILGGLTDKSWLLDPGCRLRGGFAICMWFEGPYKGDFLVSLGGYSPLVAKKPHYPELERVGFTWKMSQALTLYGDLYFALDRYGIQFGCGGGITFISSAVTIEASFSLDALVEWSPFFFQLQIRIHVRVDLRAVVILRLGLDVEMDAWGPPFGARLKVEIDLWLFKPSFTVRLGPTLAEARAALKQDFSEVLRLAKGGRDSVLQLLCGGQPAKERLRCRPDALSIAVMTAIPVAEIRDEAPERRLARGRVPGSAQQRELRLDDPIDVRPTQWEGVDSHLVIGQVETRDGAPIRWDIRAETATPLEALWYRARPTEDKRDSKRRAFTALRLVPAAGANTGLAYRQIQLKNRSIPHKHPRPALKETTPAPVKAVAAPTAPTEDQARRRRDLLGALKDSGFDLGDCKADAGSPALDAMPLRAA